MGRGSVRELEDVGRAFRMSLGDEQLRARGFEQFVLPDPLVRMLRRARTILKNRWKMYKPAVCKSLGLASRQAGR